MQRAEKGCVASGKKGAEAGLQWGAGVWAQVDAGFPVAFIRTGRQNRCLAMSCRCDQFLQEERGSVVSSGAEGLTWG